MRIYRQDAPVARDLLSLSHSSWAMSLSLSEALASHVCGDESVGERGKAGS